MYLFVINRTLSSAIIMITDHETQQGKKFKKIKIGESMHRALTFLTNNF